MEYNNLPKIIYFWITSLIIADLIIRLTNGLENFSTNLIDGAIRDLAETDFGVREATGRTVPLNELKFHSYTSENRGREPLLDPLNPIALTSGQGKIFFLIHGWHDSKTQSHWYDELTNRLLNRYPDGRIIQVDWKEASFQDYGMAAYSIESIGSHIAEIISILVTDHNVPIENFVLVGHSMGAHLCGWVGKYFAKLTNKKLARIIALDPLGALFKDGPDTSRLWRHDAQVVHVIHTDGKRMGLMYQSGTIDFYPNGAYDQPGCAIIDGNNPIKALSDIVLCSHFRSFDYFLEAVGTHGSLIAHRCPNEEALEKRK